MGISSDLKHRSPWDDPLVKVRLNGGEQPTDIWLVNCRACGNYSYYNNGSYFTCSIDGCEHSIGDDDLDAIIDAGDAITLADFTDQIAYEDLMMEGL